MTSFTSFKKIDINVKLLSITNLLNNSQGMQVYPSRLKFSKTGLCYLSSSILILELERYIINNDSADNNEISVSFENNESKTIDPNMLMNLPNRIQKLYMKNKIVNKYFKFPANIKFICMNSEYTAYKYINTNALKSILEQHNVHKKNGTLDNKINSATEIYTLNTLWRDGLNDFLRNSVELKKIPLDIVNQRVINHYMNNYQLTHEEFLERFKEREKILNNEINNFTKQRDSKKIIYNALHEHNIIKRGDFHKKLSYEEKADASIKKSDDLINEAAKSTEGVDKIKFMIKVKEKGIVFDDDDYKINLMDAKELFPGNKFLSAMTSDDDKIYVKDDVDMQEEIRKQSNNYVNT